MNTNLEAVRLLVNSLSRKDRLAILAELQPVTTPPATSASATPTGPRIVTTATTAAMLNRSRRLVHKLASENLLVRVKLPGRVRGCGYTRESVERLLAGGGATP